MKVWKRLAAIALGLAMATVSLGAHHSFAMFEMDKDVLYTGTVVEWKWLNPHVHFTILVKPGAGVDPQTVGTWEVEGGPNNILGRQGWTRASYKYGDAIKLVGHPMRDGAKGISLFYAIKPDGTRLYHDIARPADDKK